MDHDRIHAREPTVDAADWRTGTVQALEERDGHCVVTVATDDADGSVDLTVTLAIRDLFVSRLAAEEPVGQRVWFKQRGR